MSDLIKREDAIDAIECVTWYHQNRNKDMVSGANSAEHQAWYKAEDIYDALESVPSADRPQEWIPCSERLPKIGEYHISEPCLVYCKGGVYAFAELEENIFGQGGWNCERDDDYHEPIGEVVAWMPLPKPWKGADDETN